MEGLDVIDKIHELSDLELATLLCLVANEHCIISTDRDVLDELEQELQLVSVTHLLNARAVLTQ